MTNEFLPQSSGIPNLQEPSSLLAQIAEVSNLLHRHLNLDSLLQEIVQAVHHSLGFGAVVLNLVDEDRQQVRVAACAGLDDEGQRLLEGAVYTWESFANLLQEQFRVGHCYFIPHGEFNWEREFRGPVYAASDNEAREASLRDRWHPNDALFVPIELGQGRTVGIISVDQPLDGRRPGPETLQALGIFAQQAASAIQNAQLYEKAQQEIAERKQGEGILARERELLQVLMDNVPDMIFFKDAESRIIRSNRAHAYFLGFDDPQQLIGKTDIDLFSAEDALAFHAEEQEIIRTGQPIVGRVGQTPNLRTGELCWLSETKAPLLDEVGRAVGLVGIARDVTERKAAEEALQASEERFAVAVQGSQDGVWDWDIQNNSLYWSPRLKDLLGYADDEFDIDFDTFDAMLHEDDKEHVQAAIQAHLRDRTTYDVEERLRTKSGEYRWFRARGQAIWDEAGQPLRMAGSTTDITEAKQAEAERERLLTALEYRSTQLETASVVSRAVTVILDPEELIRQVVDLVQERFGLYYAGLFLVDRTGAWTGEPDKWAVLRAGSGEAGQQMLEAGHKLEIGSTSMIGWCVANAQARIAVDVGEEAVRFDNPWLPETRSEMALPLIARERVIGAMTIQSTQEAAFSGEDISVLQTMADQLAIAIENARLFEEQTQRAEETATLNQIAATVNRSRDMREFLEAVLETTMTALGYDAGLISLNDQVTDRLILASQRGLPDPLAGLFEQKGMSGTLCEFVFETAETLDIGDVQQGAPADVSGLVKNGFHAYAGTPLMYQDQAQGTLCLFSRSVRDLSAEKLSLLEAIGHQVGVGIENARLLAETQKALQEVQSTHQQYLRQEWQDFLSSRQEGENLGYVLTRDGLQPASHVWSHEIQMAMRERQPVVVTDTGADSLPGGNGDLDEPFIRARAALATPITLRGQVIGALDVFDPVQPREWTADDLALIDAVTSQVALAVENARLFEQTRGALAETEALYRASHHITTSADLPTLYQILVDELANHLAADQCQLTIFDLERGYGEVVAEYRPTSEAYKTLIPVASNPAYVILRDMQEPLAIEDVSTQPAFSHARDAQGSRDIQSMLLIPILVRSELIGSIKVDFVRRKRTFNETELDFCQTLASQAAITITNMRAFEEQKETAERLREMDKLKTQFLANMSHELRTPLNSIIGFSRVILKGIDGPLTEMQESDLTAIHNSGQHLLGLINDILDVSKIEAGKMELNFDAVDLKPIIKGVMSSAMGLVKDRPIELEQKVPEGLPNVWADPTRVRQVLLNLISNATKFTEKGKITLSADHDDEWVTIRVADTGAGIPEEKLESIFEEFTQVDGSTTRGVGGTGLGLPISRHFVEMHGGKITVESRVGVGSTFTVTLPTYPKMEPGRELVEDRQEDKASTMESQVVLSVDDDPGVISLYRRYLENEGYQVVGVSNSEEAVEKAIELQPFAITLDVLMPAKDGWQILRELKACSQTQHIPIIICSIVGNEGLGFSLGAADYLIKPIMEDELLAALARLNQRKQEEVEVLVIDDQADDILLIRRMLEAQHRYRVIEADGGQTGIDLVRQRKPDIVILDLMMPEVDGFAVLEALKREPDTRSIPVIVITAKELTEQERRRLNGQVEMLLRKGLFTEHELLEDLGKALRRIESGQSES